MAEGDTDSLWAAAFGPAARPTLYAADELNEDGFQPLADPQAFLKNLTGLTPPQLYALSSNNQLALKAAQDEYIELERQIIRIKGTKSFKNPQLLPQPDVWDEKKEAALYGYKYEGNRPALLHAVIPGSRPADDLTDRERRDVRLFQEPFEQGGFVPKEREYKAKVARARHPANVDGWTPVHKDGKRLVPKRQVHHDEYSINYIKRHVDANGEIIPQPSAASDGSEDAAAAKVVDKRLTRTRYDGKKVPSTRDVSEAPSATSTPRKRPNTPVVDGRDDTPTGKRRRVAGPDRPKHPNQYTKARELAVAAAAATNTAHAGTMPVANGTKGAEGTPAWLGLSAEALLARKWTDDELIAAVKHDHAWLHEDPDKAAEWKLKIINGVNPVRSFSMFRKWAFWKGEKLDKRPRNKKAAAAAADPPAIARTSPTPRRASPSTRKVARSGRTTPASTPAPDAANGSGSQQRNRAARNGRAANRQRVMGIKLLISAEGSEANSPPSTDGYRTEEEIQVMMEQERYGTAEYYASLQREESDSMIVVNGTPPTRRSMRTSRRASG